MYSSRAVNHAARVLRTNTPAIRHNVRSIRRYAESGSGGGSGGGSSSLLGGAAGGAAASALIIGLWYQFSGIGKAAQSAHQVKSYVDSTAEQLKIQFNEKTPAAGEAIDMLKQTAYKYATFVPGGREYVDKAFKDVEVIRNKHGEEVDKIVQSAYGELRDVSKNGLSLETLTQTWSVLSKYLQQLSSLAVDAGQDIFENHPELKNKLGGSFDQLKQFGDNLGPEAKKQLDQTYKEVQDVINEGLKWDTVDKIRKLAHDKVEAFKKLRDQAWQQGYEQVQPMLQKNPQVKKVIEENADTLKNGNIAEGLEKVKQALTSGDTGSLDEYIQSAKQKAGQLSSSGMSGWLHAIPGGSAILPHLQKLRDIAETKGPEAEQLAKDTMNDIKQVLDKRSSQVEELAKKAKDQ